MSRTGSMVTTNNEQKVQQTAKQTDKEKQDWCFYHDKAPSSGKSHFFPILFGSFILLFACYLENKTTFTVY